ncbi:hypothetical protein ACI797_17450 [Geodermatophilus sp. SYSU D00691]
MTASTEPTAVAAAPSTEVTPGSRFRRIGGGLSLIASGTLVCLSLAMIPFENNTDAEYLQVGAEHTQLTLWAAVVLHYGYLLLLPAALTLVHLARRRASRTAIAAMLFAGLGAGLSGIVAVDFYDVALATTLPADQALQVYEAAGGYGQGALFNLPAVFGLLIGTNLAVFAAWRARAIPVFPLVLGLVGWLVFFFFANDAWLPTLSTALVAISLAWCGVIVLRMRDEAWDRA